MCAFLYFVLFGANCDRHLCCPCHTCDHPLDSVTRAFEAVRNGACTDGRTAVERVFGKIEAKSDRSFVE